MIINMFQSKMNKASFSHIYLEPHTLALCTAYIDDNVDYGYDTVVSRSISDISSYGALSVNNNEVYIDTAAGKAIFAGYIFKVVLTNGMEFDVKDWCQLTGDTFTVNVTITKQQINSGSFAANRDYIFNTNYAAAYGGQSIGTRTENLTILSSTSASMSWPYEEGGSATVKGSALILYGSEQQSRFRNKIVFNSFIRNSDEAVNLVWGSWS